MGNSLWLSSVAREKPVQSNSLQTCFWRVAANTGAAFVTARKAVVSVASESHIPTMLGFMRPSGTVSGKAAPPRLSGGFISQLELLLQEALRERPCSAVPPSAFYFILQTITLHFCVFQLNVEKLNMGKEKKKTYCAANNPSQWVPGPFIKPVEEFIEAICGEMMCWSVVEPEATDGEKTDGWVYWVYGEIMSTHKNINFHLQAVFK